MGTLKTVKAAGSAMVTDGAAHVVPIGMPGSTSSYWMVAETVAANLDGATELWTSATGCLEFTISIFDGMTGGTDWAVACWDTTTVTTGLLAVAANVVATGPAGTADGSACVNACGVCQPGQSIRVVSSDGTRIKLIGVLGNAAHKYLLTVVA
jgi:hypothetical protein